MDTSYNTPTYAAQSMIELFLELDAIEVSFNALFPISVTSERLLTSTMLSGTTSFWRRSPTGPCWQALLFFLMHLMTTKANFGSMRVH